MCPNIVTMSDGMSQLIGKTSHVLHMRCARSLDDEKVHLIASQGGARPPLYTFFYKYISKQRCPLSTSP